MGLGVEKTVTLALASGPADVEFNPGAGLNPRSRYYGHGCLRTSMCNVTVYKVENVPTMPSTHATGENSLWWER